MTGGLVLAGGRSRRMGAAKAGLDWHGRPLVVHVTDCLRAALGGAEAPVVVVRAPGQPLPALAAGVDVVDDPAEGQGPLQGLAAGLAHLHARGIEDAVAVATDQPWAAAVVARLVAARRPGDDAVAFAGQPLGALYATALGATAQARLDAGKGSLRGLLAAVATRELPFDAEAEAALRSLDTPEAYAAARRALRP